MSPSFCFLSRFLLSLLADQDTAEYLLNTLPSNWLADNGVSHSKMSLALQQVRLKNPHLVFEERVARALAALGPPLPP